MITGPTSPPSPGRIALQDVHKSYFVGADRVTPMRGVSFDIHGGEVVALVGRSGAGKSTIVHVAGGLTTPDSGKVLVDGQDLALLSRKRRAAMRRRRMGFVFQFFHLMPGLSVEENVALPLVLDRRSRRPALERAGTLLEAVGLAERAAHRPSQLSGGEMQRVAIARALVHDPILIFADEPTGSLDTATGEAVMDVLTAACRSRGAALLLVTHDTDVADRADRRMRLEDGVIV